MRTGKLKTKRPVTFYSRPNCPLCDDAREVLRELEREFPLEIREVNILSDPSIYEPYKNKIPVVIADGGLTLWGRIDKDKLFSYLRGKL